MATENVQLYYMHSLIQDGNNLCSFSELDSSNQMFRTRVGFLSTFKETCAHLKNIEKSFYISSEKFRQVELSTELLPHEIDLRTKYLRSKTFEETKRPLKNI